ncbi:MAG: hypothetical protein QOC96_2075 [Acidobacteriota bacterium]|jgi:hypothetical protein|nr:hypothetical protein [Acidobacteriota bacterium]
MNCTPGLTSRSTRPRDSIPFIIACCDNIVCCSRGAGYLRRYAATFFGEN